MEEEMAVETLNICIGKTCIVGWIVGLAYQNWFALRPSHAPLWVDALLMSIGTFIAFIVIGGGIALLARGVTQSVTGRWDGSADFYCWGVFMGPIVTFFVASQTLRLIG